MLCKLVRIFQILIKLLGLNNLILKRKELLNVCKEYKDISYKNEDKNEYHEVKTTDEFPVYTC